VLQENIHTVLPFQMADARFYRCSSFHPSPQAFGCSTAQLLIHMDFNIAAVAVTTISPVHKNMLRLSADAFYLFQGI
jgi:hypothetical protein